MADSEKGVWRTVGGRRIFIKDGQDLATAMKESGKFKSGSSNKKESSGNSKPKDKDDDYELYKRAKEDPDSIDAMTENSTDWEDLEERYKDRYDKEKNGDKAQADKEELEHNERMLKEMERRLAKKDLTDEQREKLEDRASHYESAIDEAKGKAKTSTKSGGSKEYDVSDIKQGQPYTLDMGNGKKKTAIYVGKDADGNNVFYDGEGVSGEFAFSERFIKNKIKISDNKDDDKYIELYNKLRKK